MSEELNVALAKHVYKTLCDTIEQMNWKFQKDDERLLVHFSVTGEDIPMSFVLMVDVKRQLIRLLSTLPFRMKEDKRMDGAAATCVANYRLANGNFAYDLSDGTIYFKMTASFRASLIGPQLFRYLIACSCSTVDRYNDQFFAINEGILSLADFIEKETAG